MAEDDITVPFADCVLVSESGRKFSSSKTALSLSSTVFRDMLENCQPAKGSSQSPEIPLKDHTDKEVEMLWRQVHRVNPVLGYFVFHDTPGEDVLQRALDALALTEIAHKFDVKGGAFSSEYKI